MKHINSVVHLVSAFLLAIALTGCQSTPPTIQSGPDAELSSDGLHKVDNSKSDIAWARPDFDISAYTKMMLVNAGIEYAKVENEGKLSRTERTRGGPFFIDEKDRAKLKELVTSVFNEELHKVKRFTIVDEAGPDVLAVRFGLVNVATYVPPEPVGGRTYIFLNTVGEATLVLELRDSQTGTVLARTVDRRAAETLGGRFYISNSVTNSSEMKRLIRFWASRLRDNLDGLAR